MDRRRFLAAGATLSGTTLLIRNQALAFERKVGGPLSARAGDRGQCAIGKLVRAGAFLAIQPPDLGKGIPSQRGCKHVTAAFHPVSGRIFFNGGDYVGRDDWPDSYRQETWSLDLAERLANPTDRNAGWRLEYPYAGLAGGVQPKHPDYCGFCWDDKRKLFWFVPGTMELASVNPANETNSRSSDPAFIHNDVMTFDPAAPMVDRWKAVRTGAGTLWQDTWMSVLDPVKDVIVRPGYDGSGRLEIFDLATRRWGARYSLGTNAAGEDIRIFKDYLSADLAGRCFYAMDGISGRLHRISLDTYACTDLGLIPGGSLRMSNVTHHVFDTVARVLLFVRDGALHVYDPAGAGWSSPKVVTEPSGLPLYARVACFDPVNNCSLWFGNVEPPNPWMFVYQHKAAAPRSATGPAWLQGKAVNEWIAIPGTKQLEGDLSALVTAGLTNRRYDDIGYGRPDLGPFAFSGGALKKNGSVLLISGGGGLSWAGNEVRALRLTDNAPRWNIVVRPSKVSGINPSTVRTRGPYNPDGSPVSRHSYWQPMFIDQTDTFMLFGCQNIWPEDQGFFNNVDGARLSAGTWQPAGTYGNSSFNRGWDGAWQCKHPTSEAVYVATDSKVQIWTPAASWGASVLDADQPGFDRGVGAVNPSNNTIFRIGLYSRNPVAAGVIDPALRTYRPVTLTGSASEIDRALGVGLVWDDGLAKFVYFKDDGNLYTIDPSASWQVARLRVTGTGPSRNAAGQNGGDAAIYGRMQYVPELRGIVIAQTFDRNVYFVRTS
jgi:hypothetical protein